MAPDDVVRLDEFDLVEQIGTGAIADVFRAIDRRDGRVVTLKVPRPGAMVNQELVRRFRHEAVVTARLDHPLIQRNLDDRGHRTRPYLILEYLDGQNLRAELTRWAGPVPEAAVPRWMSDVAVALDHVHTNGFVHCDVKPENLVIGSDGRVRLIDFGDAVEIRRRPPRWALTSGLQGTPDYLSPEQILGRGSQPTSDLYALGIIAFEILTGAPPFQGDDLEAALDAHLSAPVPATLAARADVSDDLVDLLHALLRRSAEDRPKSARLVIERLDAFDPSTAPARVTRRPVIDDPPMRGGATSASRRQMVALVASIAFGFIVTVTAVITAAVLLR